MRSAQEHCGGESVPELEDREAEVGREGFLELIEPLKEQDCCIFTLYYVYGMKVKEIAAHMEMKENTVTTRLKRGRDALRNGIKGNRELGGRG